MARTAAYALITGFVLVIVASTAGPGEVYLEDDPSTRLEIIAANDARWTVSNLLFGMGAIVTAAGLVMLWSARKEMSGSMTVAIGALVYSAGALAWCVYLVQRILDPASYLYVRPMPIFLLGFIVLSLMGLLSLGIAWIRTSVPAWPGYVTAVGSVLIAAAGLLFPSQFYANFPPQVLYLFTLIMGIVLLIR